MNITIVITNPNHHIDQTIDTAEYLLNAGHKVKYLSLCEVRRMHTPHELLRSKGFDVVKMKPFVESLKTNSGAKSLGSNKSSIRSFLRILVWYFKIMPIVKKGLVKTDSVLMLNDTAFPGNRICQLLNLRKIPYSVLQEGIRFKLPGESDMPYGTSGAHTLFVWGNKSAEYFREIVPTTTKVLLTGSPKFQSYRKRISKLSQGISNQKVLGIFTNPIDDQGFCTTDEKFDLVEKAFKLLSKQVNDNQINVLIKSHPRENIERYIELADKYFQYVIRGDGNIEKCIASVQAGIVIASTVGLELMAAGRPIAQIKIPNYGYVFDYVEVGNAIKLDVEREDFDLNQFMNSFANTDYVSSHLANENSSMIIAEYLVNV